MSVLDLMRRSWVERRERRTLQRVPRRALADLVEDTDARVVGHARPLGPVLEAPVSGRMCVCFAVVVYAWRNLSVSIIHVEQARTPFAIEDATGRAVVEPGRARLSSQPDGTTTLVPSSSPAMRERLAKIGVADRDWRGIRALEIDESIIDLEERIAVIGRAVREPDPGAAPEGYRDDARAIRWRLIPTAISDDARLMR